jgi:hypothetical protein
VSTDVEFETDNLDVAIEHVEKQIDKKKDGERKKRISDEERADRSIHAHDSRLNFGYSKKYWQNFPSFLGPDARKNRDKKSEDQSSSETKSEDL